MKLKLSLLAAALGFSMSALANPNEIIKEFDLIHSDSFSSNLDKWVIEKTNATVQIKDGELFIDDAAGTTVWFKDDIGTPSVIEFNGAVVVEGGPNDRGTDLNWFWMAQDTSNPNDFFARSTWREGDMRKYDPMRLYYIGYGANENSTTRFRRYAGDGLRPLLPEYDVSDKKFMNVPNVMTNIKIVNLEDKIEVYANDNKLYEIKDNEPFKSGKFGFRTWKSHLKLDDFKVYAPKK
ncbi:hypothetical protein VA249_41580 [Vibrio alfacsensis]|uniref:DUF6250 domain-containing protein n=1 Tax=Vibrio alfacsensis TaxID=1074311 RepID=UPI001BEED4B4|nr:DUF6250 domain-containing protein [Vibrio alfacsensis]BBM67512.1 hypothetical protein VA249_41580 [Vibrio alfacsensis]